MQLGQTDASNPGKGDTESSAPSVNQVEALASAAAPSRFRLFRRRLKFWWKIIPSIVVSASAVATAGAIVFFIIIALIKDSIDIEPISTPKALADNGYTSEVAAGQLRDAMHRAVAFALLNRPEIALRGEHLDVKVPTVGLSVHTIARSIRKFLPVTQRPTISGEFTVLDGKLWLRLRADGREFYRNGRGILPERLDYLMNAAAERILREFWPIYFAVTNLQTDQDLALEIVEYIIATFPQSDVAVSMAHRLAGLIYMDRKQYERAKGEFEKSLRLGKKPEERAADHAGLGYILRVQEKISESDKEFRKAAELLPRNDVRSVALRMFEQKPDLALVEMRELMKRNVLNSENLTTFGWLWSLMGRQDDAISAYRKAIKLDPDNVAARFNLASILADKRLMEEATAELRNATEAHPGDSRNADFRTRLGIILREQGKLDESIAEFVKSIDLFPDDVRFRVLLGETLGWQGRSDEAIAELQKALELDPRGVGARKVLGATLRDERRFDDALVELRRAIELEPLNGPVRHELALTLLKQGNRDAAIEQFRKTLEIDPRAGYPRLYLGLALQEQGKLEEAMRELRHGLTLEPRAAFAYVRIGAILRALGKPDEAIVEFRRAIELEPRDASAHFHLASLLRSQGKLDDAIETLRTGLRWDPNNSIAHYELATALAALLTPSTPHKSRIEIRREVCDTLTAARRLAATDVDVLADIRRLDRSLSSRLGNRRLCTQAGLSRALGTKKRRR
jgi:tetratricopeptide (TPR) repeat protein